MATEQLGAPLTAPYSVAGAEARLFERGATIAGQGGEVVLRFGFPMIGWPSIARGDAAGAIVFEREGAAAALQFEPGAWAVDALTSVIRSALAERLALLPTGGPPTPTAITLGSPEIVASSGDGAQLTYRLPASAALRERQLYDVAVRTDAGHWQVVAPHAVYYRSSWADFGIVHVTDIHVAHRIDRLRGLLAMAGREEAAGRMYNWNDRFRGFVRYANYLHGVGLLDIILATGDVYDYIFDDEHDPAGGGNAEFLRKLILGQAPGPDFLQVEELRVPIFLSGGNHDYRKHAYKLLFDVRVGAGPVSREVARVENYSPYHLLMEDGLRLAYRLDALPVPEIGPVVVDGIIDIVPDVSPGEAARMVEVDRGITAFKAFLAESGTYLVRLGPHRVVMADSGSDVGMVTEVADAVKVKLGYGSEDQATFVGGSPNSEGVSDEAFNLVAAALEEPVEGLVIIGVHAPLLNPWKEEYGYYLRQTQRPAQPDQTEGFLVRHGALALMDDPLGKARGAFPLWFPDERDHRPPAFVKRGNTRDLLDYGVSRGRAQDLIGLLAGVGSRRAADVVLSGHVHRHCEFIVRRMHTGELAFYMDFYTYNPARYYPTRFMKGRDPADTDVTYVEIVEGAPANATPTRLPHEAMHQYIIAVPPYPAPLATAADPRAWWAEHRPLLLQTGALGPLKNNQVSFEGFRLLSVKADVIDKIHFVSIDRLQASDYRLPWEEAIRPEPPRTHRRLQRTREFRAPAAAGSPTGHIYPGNGAQVIIYRDGSGHLVELWEDVAGARGWGDLTRAANNATPAAGDPSVYLAPLEGLQVVLYRGTDGHVHSLYYAAGAVGHDALGGVANAPKTAGRPAGMFDTVSNTHIVLYRREDGHLITMWWQGQGAPGYEDPTAASSAPLAAGDPAVYFDPVRGDHIVIYRGRDGHIHSLYWNTGPVGHDNLSGYAGAPQAAGDPVAYKTEYDDAHQIVYRGVDGHVHELWWVGNNPVAHWDLSAVASAPPAAGDPSAYVSLRTRTKHVLYRGADGHVHAIWWVPGAGDPAHTDLSLAAAAPPAADMPRGFAGPNGEHVVYRGTDGQIHEIRWS